MNLKRALQGIAGSLVLISLLLVIPTVPPALAYPPAVGIAGDSRNCLVCHADNGPWKQDAKTIIDILDQATGRSLQQDDATFVITARRGQKKTVLTVIGRAKDSDAPPPYRNAWLYVDPEYIGEASTLSKFALGWEVNLPMSCRIVGDSSKEYPGAHVTVLPMTLRPGDEAQDADLELQVMLTKGESVKGRPRRGMLGNYFQRKVRLRVEEDGSAPKTERQSLKEGGRKTPPRFTLSAVDGREVQLATYLRAKVVMLWFTNLCGGCQSQLTVLQSLYQGLRNRPVEFLAISLLGPDSGTVARSVEKYGIDFPFLVDPEGKVAELYTGEYIAGTCPLSNLYIIDKSGRISFEAHFPGETSVQDLEDRLKETLEAQS